MNLSPVVRQFLVAGSTHLAALSAGGVIAYPGVLLQQLKANDTIIELDLHKGSWIGSVHGIAGVPSVLMPLLMQYRGRKSAFILSCIFMIAGWLLTYNAWNILMLIIGECFHGLGINSLIAVSFLSVTEMVRPSYRNTCLILYGTAHALGLSLVGILGRYLHWKTISMILCSPVLAALAIGCAWPESPSWLACKGKFKECEDAFRILRGTDEASNKELEALLDSQKHLQKMTTNKSIRGLGKKILSRDFYLPTIHTFFLINVLHWGGGMPVVVYSDDMILKTSGRPNELAKLIMNVMFFVGYCIALVLIRYFTNKTVMLFSMSGSATFMTLAAITTYLQSLGIVPKDSELGVYFLIGFFGFLSLGSSCLGFSIASELMPVKHRGIGGCLYIIFACLLHSSALKAYPYLVLFTKISGMYIIFSLYNIFSIVFIWKCVPETKNKTLQEIEEYYNYGFFKEDRKCDDFDVPFIKTDSK